MVRMDGDGIMTLKGSRLLGHNFPEYGQGQFFEEACDLEAPAVPLDFSYHPRKVDLYRLEKLVISP